MNNFDFLTKKLNECTAKSLGKIFFALFVLMIAESFVTAVTASPAVYFISAENTSVMQIAAAAVCLFVSLALWFIFQFGFAVMVLRLARDEYVTVGYIFYGFRNLRLSLPVSLVYSMITGAISAFFCILSYSFSDRIKLLGEKIGIFFVAGAFVVVMFLVIVAVLIHFVFVFQIRYDNPSINAFKCFGRSSSLIRRKIFRFIGFVLRAGGRNLVIAVGLFIVTTAMPVSENNRMLSVILLVLNFLYFINAYKAMSRMYLAVPVFYEYTRLPAIPVIQVNDDKAE